VMGPDLGFPPALLPDWGGWGLGKNQIFPVPRGLSALSDGFMGPGQETWPGRGWIWTHEGGKQVWVVAGFLPQGACRFFATGHGGGTDRFREPGWGGEKTIWAFI